MLKWPIFSRSCLYWPEKASKHFHLVKEVRSLWRSVIYTLVNCSTFGLTWSKTCSKTHGDCILWALKRLMMPPILRKQNMNGTYGKTAFYGTRIYSLVISDWRYLTWRFAGVIFGKNYENDAVQNAQDNVHFCLRSSRCVESKVYDEMFTSVDAHYPHEIRKSNL